MSEIYRGVITNMKKEVISDAFSNTTTTNTTDIGTNYKYGNLFKGDLSANKKQYIEGSLNSTTYTSSYTVHNFIYTFELSGKNDKFRFQTENADMLLDDGDDLVVNYEKITGGYSDIDYFINITRGYHFLPKFEPSFIKYSFSDMLIIILRSFFVFVISLFIFAYFTKSDLAFIPVVLVTGLSFYKMHKNRKNEVKNHNEKQLQEKRRVENLISSLEQAAL